MGNDVGRELVRRPASTSPANANGCPKCGKFGKSGRVSCCAPGGAWYKKCGSAKNKNVQYKGSQGTDACKKKPARTTTAAISACAVCGSVKKSRKKSCCGRGGSWYRNCGTSGNKKSKKFDHTWFEGIQACKSKSASKSAAASYQEMNAAEKYVFNFANNTAKPSHEITTADKVTTSAAPAKVATTAAEVATTFAAKKTPLPTTDWIENEEVFEAFGVSGSVSVSMSHFLAMFSIFIILLK